MAALDHDDGRAERSQCASSLALLGEATDRGAEQHLCLAQVRGEDAGVWQQRLDVERLRLGIEQAIAAGGHHHGVDDEVRQSTRRRELRDRGDDGGRGEHAGLHRGDGQVLEDRFDLLDDELRGHDVDAVDAAGVLGGQCRDGRGAVDAEGSEGFEVGLDAGATAGVRAGDGQCDGRSHEASWDRAAR